MKKFWVITKDINKTMKTIVNANQGIWDGDDDGSSFVLIPDDHVDAFDKAMDDAGFDFDVTC